MPTSTRYLLPLLLAGMVCAADPAPVAPAPGPGPGPGTFASTDLRRLPAPEARQGVAADAEFLYAISNHALGKYRKDTGARVATWECPEGDPLIHLNAGIVHEGRLYCAHSNYPGVPQLSSVEIWDTATLRHVASRSFGRADGSLTWLDRHHDRWIACFVHYANRGGEPGRGPEWTRLVEFDDEWRITGGWAFPAHLMVRLAERGFSVSGGAFGPGGYLYVTGHDHPELYVLAMPDAGPTLKWIATIPITAQGQAFAWDPAEPGVLHTISKSGREIITSRITGAPPIAAATPPSP